MTPSCRVFLTKDLLVTNIFISGKENLSAQYSVNELFFYKLLRDFDVQCLRLTDQVLVLH